MRMTIIRNIEDEKLYYKTGAFRMHEDLVIFPYWEFDALYNDLKYLTRLLNNVLEGGVSGLGDYTPEDGIKYAENYIKIIQEQLDNLTRYDVQTEIINFPGKQKSKNSSIKKETPQCLIGL
ncbi:MAG: hypothetical protein Q8N08_09185 [Methanobacteriaceae archaeon]|nr:hypothetical protein [Methanobacteriaceae archaeon]